MNWDPLWNYKPDHSLIIGSYHNQKKLRNKIKRWTQTYLTDQSTYGQFWSERKNREANPVRLTHEPFSYWGLLPGQRRRSHIWSGGWGVEFPTWCSGDLLSFFVHHYHWLLLDLKLARCYSQPLSLVQSFQHRPI